MLVNTFFEKHVDQLLDVAARLSTALQAAGIEYRIVGGLAVYLHVDAKDPLAARLTRDIDAAIIRADLRRIIEAVRPLGFADRRVAGVDMLVDAAEPTARSAVHLSFVGEFAGASDLRGNLLVAPVADLVKMKLTSFRDKDRVHLRDLDSVGLITPEIEAGLSPELAQRLEKLRSTE